MKSSIRIDFADLHGKGLEPIIRVNIISSDDPRDGLVKTLFQSLGDYLEVHYHDHKHTITKDSLPDMEKSVILFKPKLNMFYVMEALYTCFNKWLAEEKYVISTTGKHEGNGYVLGDKYFTEDELLETFISKMSTYRTGQ